MLLLVLCCSLLASPAAADPPQNKSPQTEDSTPQVEAPRILSKGAPESPTDLRLLRGRITVGFEVLLNAEGSLQSARVVRSAGTAWDGAAHEALRQWRFSPARVDGVPVASRVHAAVVFEPSPAEPETSVPPATSAPVKDASPKLDDESHAPIEHEVTVVAQRALLPVSTLTPTAASTVIEGEELRAAGVNAAQVLRRVPGVQVSRTGAGADLSTASIRGSDSNQVPVYLAGIRTNDDVTGTADLSTIPLWMIDRVEVYRGNAPERADQLGIGGAIFFTPRVPRKTRVGGGVGVGSFAERAGWVSGEVAGESASALVALRHAQAENDYKFINDEGQRFALIEQKERRRNADFSENEAWALARFKLGRGAHVQSIVQAFEREQGVSGLSVIPALAARAKTRRQLFGLSSRVPCRPGREGCVLELSSSLLTTNVVHNDPYLELPALRTSMFQNRGERFTQIARLSAELSPQLRLATSLLHNSERLRIDRVAATERRAQRRRSRFASALNWQSSEHLLLHGLVALECNTTSGTSEYLNQTTVQNSGSCGLFAPTGRMGFRYAATPSFALLGNASRYIRAPTLSELYGSSALVNGNATLQPESGWSGDFGTRATWRAAGPRELQLALDLFAFARRAEDLIRFRRTSLKAVSPFNVESARFLGAELAGALSALSFLKVKSSVSLLDPRETTPDAEDPTQNDILPLTSRFVFNQELEFYRQGGVPQLLLDFAALTFRYFYRSPRYQDSGGLTVLPEQHLLEVETLGRFWHEHFALRLSGKFLLQEQASDLLGLPLPHSSFHAQLEAWF